MAPHSTEEPDRVEVPLDNPSDSEPESVIEKWYEIVEEIRKTTKEASAGGPPFGPSSPSIFQSYWRTVFTRLRQSISENPDIPRHLTTPPVRKFTIALFDALHGRNCPCCHPDVEPNIVLENKDGVTKEDFMDAFVGYMYGDVLPRVYIEPFPLKSRDGGESEVPVEEEEKDPKEYIDDAGALVYSFSWMSGSIGEDDETEAYSTEPNIVLYCCWENEYAKRLEEEDTREREMEERGRETDARRQSVQSSGS